MATAQEVTERGKETPQEDPNLALVNEIQDALFGSENHDGRANDSLNSQIENMLRVSGSTSELDLTKIDREGLDLAIKKLTELREPVAKAHEEADAKAADLRSRIGAILDTDRGVQVNKAREAFEDLDDLARTECQVPTVKFQGRNLNKYDFDIENVDMEELDEDYYDPNEICTLNIKHLTVYSDDFDYGGGHTEVTLKLDDKGNIEYKFSGDEIDAFLIFIFNPLSAEGFYGEFGTEALVKEGNTHVWHGLF